MATSALKLAEASPRWVVDGRWLLYLLVFVAVFAGFQGGRYFLANRLQELGIACALLLFAIGAWRGLFRLSLSEWRRWVVVPMLLVGTIMVGSAAVFAVKYGGNFAFSFFSAREFLLAFVGPGLYLLGRTGVPVPAMKRIVWLALVTLMLNYLLFYFTMDLKVAFFSSDHTVSNLVTYDEWRGFRLKPPLFAIMVGLLASLMVLGQARSLAAFLLALAVLLLATYIWSIVLFRATLATLLLSLALYPLFLSQGRRVSLAVVLLPLGLLVFPWVLAEVLELFRGAAGGGIRARAFMAAFDHFSTHWLLGAGEDSAYGQSYQDIVAPWFFPSDIGLAGTAFKYGLAGVVLYLWMHTKIWWNLWRAHLYHRATVGRQDPLLWALLIFMTAQSFNLILNPGLAYAQGITLGAVALALSRLALQPSD
jgi:hypothetical protein